MAQKKKTSTEPKQKLDEGRPPKYNDPMYLEPFFRVLKVGASIQAACSEAKLNRSTVTKWISLARQGDEKYQEFFTGYKKARASNEVSLVACIRQASTTQWQAAAWLLERLQPKRYGRKNSVSFQGEAVVKNGAIAPEQFVKMLTASQLSQLITAIENRTVELEAAKGTTDANV